MLHLITHEEARPSPRQAACHMSAVGAYKRCRKALPSAALFDLSFELSVLAPEPVSLIVNSTCLLSVPK